MKKKIVMMLVAAMAVVCLFGCAADTKKENVATQDEVSVILRDEEPALAETSEFVMTDMIEETVEETLAEPDVARPEILITPIEETWYTEDGVHELLKSSWCKVEVTNQGFETLALALNEWSDLIYNQILSESEEYASWAAEEFSFVEKPEYFVSYYDYFSVGATRIDDVVVSLAGGFDLYIGGAHGNHGFAGYTYDVTTGELITLDRLIADDEGFQAAAIDKILSVLQEEPYVAEVFPDYDSTVRGMFAQDGYVSWYLSEEGIVIPFDPYVIGPYTMPELRVVLPYEDFAQYMAIKYRPN